MKGWLFGIGWPARHVWLTQWTIFRKLWFSRIAWTFGEPLLYTVAFGLGVGSMVEVVQGMSYMQFVAPGILIGYVMYATCMECTYNTYSAIERKLFDAMVAAPLTIEDVIGGIIGWGITRGAIITVGMLVVFASVGLVESPWAVLILPLAILTGWCFSALATWVTSLVKSFDHFNYLWGFYVAPAYLFSGIFFPLDTLPKWMQWMSWVFPTTYVVEPARHLMVGPPTQGDLLRCLFIAAVSWALTGLAISSMRRRLVT